jgi:hypothetical protein
MEERAFQEARKLATILPALPKYLKVDAVPDYLGGVRGMPRKFCKLILCVLWTMRLVWPYNQGCFYNVFSHEMPDHHRQEAEFAKVPEWWLRIYNQGSVVQSGDTGTAPNAIPAP